MKQDLDIWKLIDIEHQNYTTISIQEQNHVRKTQEVSISFSLSLLWVILQIKYYSQRKKKLKKLKIDVLTSKRTYMEKQI